MCYGRVGLGHLVQTSLRSGSHKRVIQTTERFVSFVIVHLLLGVANASVVCHEERHTTLRAPLPHTVTAVTVNPSRLRH